MSLRPICAVAGGSSCSREEYAEARLLGNLLAQAGFAVLTGGLGGVMEAASRGAAEAGGLVVGVLPGPDRDDANPWVELALPTGLGDARNALVAGSGDVLVAVAGSFGTLSEIALALKHGTPVVTLGSWTLDPARLPPGAGPVAAADAEDAARRAVEAVEARTPGRLQPRTAGN